MKPPRARRPSGCPVPYDRGRFGAFLSSVARDTSPSPNSSPLPTPPHLLEVQQPAGGVERLDAVRPAGQASNTGRKKLALGFLGAAGMRCCYTARTGAPPLPSRPRFWPRKPAEASPSGPFFAAEPYAPETRWFWMGRGGERSRRPGRQKIAIPKRGRRDRPLYALPASYWRGWRMRSKVGGEELGAAQPHAGDPALDCPARYLRIG